MLLDYLDKVRQKPRAARKRFAFFVSVGITLVVAIIWGFTLPARFASLSIKGDSMMGSAGVEEFGDQLDESKQALQEAIDLGQSLLL